MVGNHKSFNEPDLHQNGKKPLCFDFKNYRIHWDPRVEELVNKLRLEESRTRIVGNDHSQDDLLADDDELFFYSDGEDNDKLEQAFVSSQDKAHLPSPQKPVCQIVGCTSRLKWLL